ncbi:MAG: Mpo1-like protein, partial [Pseudomonadota bacterium]
MRRDIPMTDQVLEARRPIDSLIAQYAESHRHPTNVAIHWVCVPIIVWCTLALAWIIHPWVAVAGAGA